MLEATRATATHQGWGLRPPPGDRVPSSPVRVRGSSPRSIGPRLRGCLVRSGPREVGCGTRVVERPRQVSRSRKMTRGINGLDPGELDEEDGDIEDLFGQLWFISSTSPSPCGRARVHEGGDLIWIRKDLWDSKQFEVRDCFPVGASDLWASPPKKLCFASDIWGKGVRDSFVAKLKQGMATHGRGGRGPRPRISKEEWGWGDGGWYNQPPPFFPPPMGPMPPTGPYPPPQGQYGFFPNPPPANPYYNQNRGQASSQFNQQYQRGQGS